MPDPGWSERIPWEDIVSGKVRPPNASGVYRAGWFDDPDLLATIGKATSLAMRVAQGLVKGNIPHSAGERIRANEDTENMWVQWLITDAPRAAEKLLQAAYQITHDGSLPKYTRRK